MDWGMISAEAEYLQTKCGLSKEKAFAEAIQKWLIYINCVKNGVPWQ